MSPSPSNFFPNFAVLYSADLGLRQIIPYVILTKSPHFYLLCCEPKNREQLGQDLHGYLRNARSEISMDLEALQEAPDAVKEVNERIVAGANVLGRLRVEDYSVTRPVLAR